MKGLLDKKRQEFTRHLVRSLDILCYSHLLYLYFMDISLFRLFIRSLIQLNYLTPKPFLYRSARTNVVLGIVILSNVYCFLTHLFARLPISREANAGYLHGGLTIEFIGQKPPTSKVQLLVTDMVVLFLQVLMLTVSGIQDQMVASRQLRRQARRRQRQQEEVATETTTAEVEQVRAQSDLQTLLPQQTIDDEERGQITDEAELSQLESEDQSDGFSGEIVAVEIGFMEFLGWR